MWCCGISMIGAVAVLGLVVGGAVFEPGVAPRSPVYRGTLADGDRPG